MKNKTLLVVVFIALFLVMLFLVYKTYTSPDMDSQVNTDTSSDFSAEDGVENEEEEAPPTFTWSFEEADTMNLDGMPETDLFLTAVYEDGRSERKLIDTTPGSCNALPEVEADTISGTDNIQCYSAGLGYRYKITEGDDSYQVKRQTFEEAMPNYEPPEYEYELVAEFAWSY